MTLTELKQTLTAITGFADKVTYYAWPEGTAPALPFICFFETGADNFAADGIVFCSSPSVSIELYTKLKDEVTEGAVEAALTAADLYFTKQEQYLGDEKCYLVLYTVNL